MAGPQIIRTPNGAELVVLPRAEYEALADGAAEAEEDAVLPPKVSAAILRGDGASCASIRHG